MIRKSFFDFLMIQEGNSPAGGGAAGQPVKSVSPEVKLADNSEFKPFVVDEEHNKELRQIVKAFSESDKIPLPGPSGVGSKMTTLDAKGESIPRLKKKTLHLALIRRKPGTKLPDLSLAAGFHPEKTLVK